MEPHLLDLEYWKELWGKWDLRFFIILSLILQTFLILFAPFRKRISDNWIIMLLWSAYLLADWAANFAISLISSSQRWNHSRNHSHNPNLLAFWAPFLLVHLGGPDTITAFALQDNELWLRHFLGLIFQTLATTYVFFRSLPLSELSIPTTMMFFTGLVKYLERTRALYLASLNSFRKSMLKAPDPCQNYAKLMDVYLSKKEANLPTRIVMIAKSDSGTKEVNKVPTGILKRIEILHHTHKYYEMFKGIIVDMIFGFHKRNQTRDFFLGRTAEDAFAVVEVELNFFYEALYTKASVIHTVVGCVFRFVSFILVIVSFSLFYTTDKKGFHPSDVKITYTLLIGAILLDMIAFVMLVFSNWTLVKMYSDWGLKFLAKLAGSWFSQNRRWSESISAYNLIYYCLHPHRVEMDKFAGYLGLNNFLDGWKYVKKNKFTNHLRDHIFAELRSKSELADDIETAREICSSRGDWVLRAEGCTDLLQYVNEVDYDQSLLIWHIATELCYENDQKVGGTELREVAKVLSDYMLYLLQMQPMLMSPVAGIGHIRFRDTCAEAKNFFQQQHQQQQWGGQKVNILQVVVYVFASFFKYLALPFILLPIVLVFAPFCLIFRVEIWPYSKAKKRFQRWKEKENRERREQKDACDKIFNIKAEVKPMAEKDDPSKSVLFDACVLAKELEKLGEEKKWNVMSKVWVELMCYAACHCRADAHAAVLSKGGELITIVWLLMANLGLGNQFQINEGNPRAMLIVGK